MIDLPDLIAKMDWDDWHDTDDGVLHFVIEESIIKFYCRIGLHIRRPMEAIIAKGEYVRMRAAPEWGDYELERLDPENPNRCLYVSDQPTVPQYVLNTDSYKLPTSQKLWVPKYPKGYRQQQAGYLAQQQMYQHQLQAAQAQAQQAQLNRYNTPTLGPYVAPCQGFRVVTTDNTTAPNSSLFGGLGGLLTGLKW